MRNSLVAKRYAKSLLDLAVEQGRLEACNEDMKFLSKLIDDNRELGLLLKSPVIKADKKQAILDSICEGNISEISLKFIRIIISKKREVLLREIANNFVEQYKIYNNIVTAKVRSAVKLSDSQRKDVLGIIGKITDKKIELEEFIDIDLIGGFIIKVGDKQIDASVAKKLNDFKRMFSENLYVAEI